MRSTPVEDPVESVSGLALRRAGPFDLSSIRLGDAPLILAFSSDWRLCGESAADLGAIRAELRGLGAVLVVLSSAGVWFFRPDDDVERFELTDDAIDAEIGRLAALYEVPRSFDGTLAPVIFVLDGGGHVRFAMRSPPGAPPMHATLAEALASAGRQIIAAPAASATVSRREWILGMVVAGFALAFAEGCGRSRLTGTAGAADATEARAPATDEAIDVVLNVNGGDHHLRIDSRVSLLDALRERLGLTGSKKGCDHGQCGACTVLVDGRRACACLMLAVMAQGRQIRTIEGLAHGDDLHPMQAAFLSLDGLQCGYCTPGQIMSAVSLVAEGHAHTDDEVREEMSGNICRCGAYPNIVAAVQLARKSS